MAWLKWPLSLLVEVATQSAFWVLVRLLEGVVLAPARWEALMLGCNYLALGFFLEVGFF